MELILTAVGTIVAVLALALERGWLPPKYPMADPDPLQDPALAAIFGPEDVFRRSPRNAQVVPRHLIPKYKADGFSVVRIALGKEFRLGRECVWVAAEDNGTLRESVLMARPHGPLRPLTFDERLTDLCRQLTEWIRYKNAYLRRQAEAPSASEIQKSLVDFRDRYRALHAEFVELRSQMRPTNEQVHQIVNAERGIAEIEDFERALRSQRGTKET